MRVGIEHAIVNERRRERLGVPALANFGFEDCRENQVDLARAIVFDKPSPIKDRLGCAVPTLEPTCAVALQKQSNLLDAVSDFTGTGSASGFQPCSETCSCGPDRFALRPAGNTSSPGQFTGRSDKCKPPCGPLHLAIGIGRDKFGEA